MRKFRGTQRTPRLWVGVIMADSAGRLALRITTRGPDAAQNIAPQPRRFGLLRAWGYGMASRK